MMLSGRGFSTVLETTDAISVQSEIGAIPDPLRLIRFPVPVGLTLMDAHSKS